jgi:hypothetical protein
MRPGQPRWTETVGRGEQHAIGLKRLRPVEPQPEAAAIADASRRHRIDDFQLDVRPCLNRIEEALAHIFAEELAREEGVGEAFMQAGMIFALIELAKGPVQKIARLAGANRKIAGAHIEKVQGMMRAIGDATPKRSARFNHDEAERPVDAGKAGDGSRRAGESTADYADR